MSEASNVYAFEVDPRSTKGDVMKAMKVYYKVTPVRVNMITIPSKRVLIRGKRGVKSSGKKAYVYLKEGDTIEII